MILREEIKKFNIYFGKIIIEIGKSIQPDYWRCCNCGYIEYKEEEVICWKCSVGDMIYKG